MIPFRLVQSIHQGIANILKSIPILLVIFENFIPIIKDKKFPGICLFQFRNIDAIQHLFRWRIRNELPVH